jgi:pSer/pThr/pTyr-binding forkhead associated (FHA) protein/S1-C subfamily serine protease
MPYLRLTNLATGESHESRAGVVRIGRDPETEVVVAGAGSEVVSASHARAVHREGRWWIEDVGSRNGTYLDDRRLVPAVPLPLARGQVVRLGARGPRFRVDALDERRVAETLAEAPVEVGPGDVTAPIPAQRVIEIAVVDSGSGRTHRAAAGRIRVGRGAECDLRPVATGDTSVSRVHAEIVLTPGGEAMVRDARSKNGTLVNGARLEGEHPLVLGDRLKLGPAGPELRVVALTIPEVARYAPESPARPPQARPPRKSAVARAAALLSAARRSFGGKGATVFFSEMMRESSRRSAHRLRIVVWSVVTVLVAAVAAIVWYKGRLEQRLEARLEDRLARQQATADSVRAAAQGEYDRLRQELEAARAGAAPVTVLDSLRAALSAAEARTAALEEALRRAQGELARQLASADSALRASRAEQARLAVELDRARSAGMSGERVDSLLRAVRDAEERSAAIASQMRAVEGQGGNLAAIAQASQAAVGLVTTYVGQDIYDGSGFALSPTGYFVTNRHVVLPTGKPPGDSVFVTMADQKTMRRAAVIAVAPPGGPDLALLRISGHDGSAVARIDWSSANAHQGEPAALIGFPAGLGNALDATGVVRTSMTAGIFSKVTADAISFDGFTIGGSSGSPIFNARGEVVAVHRAGLSEAVGMGFAVPIPKLVPLLPADLKAQLGLR